jgi:hypothetical protein
MIIFVLIILLQIVFAQDLYSHAELQINEGEYSKLNEELREWLESEIDTNKQYTKRIVLKEEPGSEITTPKLVFVNSEGKPQETIFADYIPVSMVQSLVKEKKWVDSEDTKKQEL